MAIWRIIPSFPAYAASAGGQICSRRGLLKQHRTWNGYLYVNICGARMVSRLVCEAFHGPTPSKKHQAAHRNSVRTDNRRSNLYWLTRRQNYADQINNGTHKKGENHHNVKLTNTQVYAIRIMARTRRHKDIARDFGISASHVSQIVHRQLWPHI